MGFTFRPATREGTHLIVGLMGGTGSGKTYSAMRLATGLAGDKRFAVIDTEAGRAKHYADDFAFDHGDLSAPFRPDAYAAAILAAEKAGYPVIVVDSMSHEHAGEGGLLDWHEEEFQRMGSRDAAKMTAWIKPKMSHKAMMQKLLQLRAHLILCFRAEPKIKIVQNAKGKMEPVDDGWKPICAKGIEFEMVASWLLSHESPGLANAPLKIPERLKPMFPRDKPFSEDSGRALARWAAGDVAPPEVSAFDMAMETIDSAGTRDELATAYKMLPKMVQGADLAKAQAECARRGKAMAEAEAAPDSEPQTQEA